MGAGKPKGDGTKSQLVDKDRSTWTWENLSQTFPEDNICSIVQLAALQPFAGVSLFFRGFW